MAKEILKSDEEEYDAKQPPVKKEDGLKAQAAKYRTEIEGISDDKLLNYIASCCHAKMQMLSAEERLTEKDSGEPAELPIRD